MNNMHVTPNPCESGTISQPLRKSKEPSSPMYFASIGDFVTTIMKVNVASFASSVMFALGGLITGYVYHDAYAVTTLICLFGLDLVTGIYASYIRKADEEELEEGLKTFVLAIQSRKLLRSFISMTFHLALLSVAWHVSKSQDIFSFLPGLLVGAIFGTQLVSISENLYKAKVIKSAVFETLMDAIDLKKLLAKRKPKP
jgi:hypothetical protein